MKSLMIYGFALALWASLLTWGQDTSQQSNPQGTQSSPSSQSSASQGSTTSQGANQNVSGTVSKNGKSFVNDADNKTYTVSNPDVLAGHEGQHVALVVHVDPDTNAIHIMQIAMPPQ